MMQRPNVPIALLSLVIAMIAWFFVYGQNLNDNIQMTLHLNQSNIVNQDSDHWYVDGISDALIKLEAPIAQLDVIKRRSDIEKAAKIDLSDAQPGKGLYPIIFDPSIANYVIGKPRVQVVLEKIVSRNVKVRLERKGNLKDKNLTVQTYAYQTKTAVATGPETEVRKITWAHGYVNLDEVQADRPESQDVYLNALDGEGVVLPDVVLHPSSIQVQPILIAEPGEKRVLVSSPKVLGSPAAGYEQSGLTISPASVELTGDFGVLSTISQIETEPVDVTGLTASKLFRVKLKIPVLVKSKTGDYVKVRYLVQPTKTNAPTASPGPLSKQPSGTTPQTQPLTGIGPP